MREKRILSLREAIHRMTGKTARRVGLADGGAIAEGAYADLTIFDPDVNEDTATFESPAQYPNGISYVIVYGKIAVENRRHKATAARKVLRIRRS